MVGTYKAQRLTQEYEKQGGSYKGEKDESQRSLERWTEEESVSWACGMDFPFGQLRPLIEALGLVRDLGRLRRHCLAPLQGGV